MTWKFWQKRAAAPAPKGAEPASQKIDKASFRIPTRLLESLGGDGQKRSAFALTPPVPGVLPDGNTGMAMDQTINVLARWGDEFGGGEGVHWLGFAYLAELSQRPEFRRISAVKAKEMTRRWIRLTSVGDKNKNDQTQQILKEMDRLKVQDSFRRAAELDGLFGRSHIYLDTGNTDDPEELKLPLFVHKDKIGLGALKAIRVVDPTWVYPSQYDSVDPLRQDFYRPQSWYVMAKEIHSSRLLTFVGREMPDLLKPSFQFGGLSMTQMAKPYVDLWLRDRTSVSDLINFFSTSVLSTNMVTRMQDREGEGLLERIEAFVKFRKNRGVLAIDKETEEFSNVSAQLGTLDKLQAQAQEHICSVIGMPLVKYTGITPSGLNASSDGEIRVWYDEVLADQEDMFTEPLQHLLKIIQLSLFGYIDEGITHDFVSLWQLDEAGAAAVQKTKADTHAVYLQEGVIAPEEVREEISNDPESLYAGLDLSGPPPIPPTGGGEVDTDDPETNRVDEGAFSGNETGANSGV